MSIHKKQERIQPKKARLRRLPATEPQRTVNHRRRSAPGAPETGEQLPHDAKPMDKYILELHTRAAKAKGMHLAEYLAWVNTETENTKKYLEKTRQALRAKL